jgi:dipeptidase
LIITEKELKQSINMKTTRQLFILCLLILSLNISELKSCTTVIAGKKTTSDGSILFAKSEDDIEQLDYYWYISHKKHKPVKVILEIAGLAIPQVAETCLFLGSIT